MTLRNNTVGPISDDDDFPFGAGPNQAETHAIRVESRNDSVLRLDIADNSADGLGGNQDYLVRQRDTSTFALERLTGNAADDTNIQNFIAGQNPSPAGQTARATHATTYTAIADGTVQDPALPLLFAPPSDAPRAVPGRVGHKNPARWAISACCDYRPASGGRRCRPACPSRSRWSCRCSDGRWAATGLTEGQLARLWRLRFEIADLPAGYLAEAGGDRIQWTTTPPVTVGLSTARRRSPRNLRRRAPRRVGTRLRRACPLDASTCSRRLCSQMGHMLGLDDTGDPADRDDGMFGHLSTGERRVSASGRRERLRGIEERHRNAEDLSGFQLRSSCVSREP